MNSTTPPIPSEEPEMGYAEMLDFPETSTLAVVALVFSVLGAIAMIFVVGLIFSVPAVVLAHLGLSQIKKSGGRLLGTGFAVAALITGYISVLFSTAILVIILCIVMPAYRNTLPSQDVRNRITDLRKAGPEKAYDEILQTLSSGQQEEAEDMLDGLVRTYQSDQRLAFLQAVCSRSRWKKRRAGRQFRKALKMNPASVEGKCARYVLNLDNRKYVDDNFNGLRHLVKEYPDNSLLLWMFAMECREHYIQTEETTYSEEGAQACKKLLEIFDVGPLSVHQTYANILSEELGQHEEALAHRRIAVEQKPESWTYKGLARTLSYMKKYDEANQAYAKLMELYPDNARYWQDWAWSLERQGRDDESIEKCRKAIQIDTKCFMPYNTWGRCLEKQGKYDDALLKYKKAIEMNPSHFYAHKSVARVLMSLKKYDEANQAYAKLMELYPDNAEHWCSWAGQLHNQGRHDEGIEKCKKAIQIDPGCFDAYDIWGCCLEKQEKYKEALLIYKEMIVKIEPHLRPRAYKDAARVLKKMGNHAEAQEMLEKKNQITKKGFKRIQ